MANEREIKIVIRSDGTHAITDLRGVGTELDRVGQRSASFAEILRKNWLQFTAAAIGAAMALERAWGFAEKAAQYAESLETLNALSSQYGVTGQQMVKTISENSQGLIDLASAAKVSADALAKGFTPAQLAQMAQWAPMIDDFSASVGSSREAFETLVSSMAAGRERGVVQLLGATIDLEAAFGKQAAAMSKAEKATAIYNLVAQRMAEIQKTGIGTTDSLADKIERYKNQVEDLKLTIGDFIIRAGAGLMATFQSVSALALGLARVVMAPLTALMMATDYLGITKGKAEEYRVAMEAMANAGVDLAEKANANFELMKKGMRSGEVLAPKGGNLGLGVGVNRKAEEKEEEERLKRFLAHEQLKAEAEEEFNRIRREAWDEYGKLILKEQEMEDKALAYRQEKTAEYLLWEAEAREKAILEEYDRVIEAENRLTEIRRGQKTLLFESKMADAQSSLNAIGASDMAGNVGMLGAIAAGEDPYTRDFNRWKQLQDEKLAYMAVIGASEQEWNDALREYDIRQEEMRQQQKIAMAGNTFGMLAGMATALYDMQGQKGGAAFEMMKAMRIGETVMNTYSAAVGAYNAMVSIPYVGPALAVAAAAAAIAFGMAQVRAIASMKPGNQGTPSMSGASAGGVGSVSIPSTPSKTKEPETKTTPIVNVHVYGVWGDVDAAAREIAPAITKAWADGVR